jgi:hypothetical protein
MRSPRPTIIPTAPALQDFHSWHLERRADGAVLVRVPSRVVNGRALPDAVFAFRAGDPQYAFWDAQLRNRNVLAAPSPPMPIIDVNQNVD